MNFPFGTNGNLLFLGVPILKHIRVFKAFLYHAEFKTIKLNWTIAQMNGFFFQKWGSKYFAASIAIVKTNNISCIRTFLGQFTYSSNKLISNFVFLLL